MQSERNQKAQSTKTVNKTRKLKKPSARSGRANSMDSNRSITSINSELEEALLADNDDLKLSEKIEHLSDQLDKMTPMETETSNLMTNQSQKDNKTVANNDILNLLLDIKKTQFTKKEGVVLGKSFDVKFNAIDKELKEHGGRFVEIEDRISQFETKLVSAAYDRELIKQQVLKNNISIFGCPKSDGEVIAEVALEIFKAFGNEFSSSDFDAIYRTEGKRPSFSSIIVKFVNFEKKLIALNNKAKKPVKLSDVYSDKKSNAQIYLNNHVTPYFGRLLAAGRQAIKEELIHSCWIGATGCLIKLQKDGKPINIRTVEGFDKIREKGGQPSSTNTKRSKPDDHTSPLNKTTKKTR